MTRQQHPITPPPELVQQWRNKGYGSPGTISSEYVATRAAQWGADQEREEICKWLEYLGWHGAVQDIRADHIYRRPKPLSLKVEALSHFQSYAATFETAGGDSDLIRRALESIPDPS
jgi:hypothetical protein